MNAVSFYKEEVPLLGSILPPELGTQPPIDRLNAIHLVFQRSIDALSAFKEGSLTMFDASVGDQACQIRALQIALLSLEDSIIDSLKEQCLAKIVVVEELRQQCELSDKKTQQEAKRIKEEKNVPLQEEKRRIGVARSAALKGKRKFTSEYERIHSEFQKKFEPVTKQQDDVKEEIQERIDTDKKEQQREIENANLEIKVDGRSLFLIQAFMVTVIKDTVFRMNKSIGVFEYPDHMKLTKLEVDRVPFNAKIGAEIIDIAKKAIVELSVCFVRYQADLLKSSEAALLQKMVSQDHFIEKKQHVELPFFYEHCVIFKRALEERVPILLKVRNVAAYPGLSESFRCRLLFTANEDCNKYEVASGSLSDFSRKAIIIEALCRKGEEDLRSLSYQRELFAHAGDLVGVVKLNTAQHLQYTDQKDSTNEMFDMIPGISDEEKERLVKIREKAITKGFSEANREMCCIQHIYCNQLEKEIYVGKEKS